MVYNTWWMYTNIMQEELQIVDNRNADEVSVSEIFFQKYLEHAGPLIPHNYKKTEDSKNCQI